MRARHVVMPCQMSTLPMRDREEEAEGGNSFRRGEVVSAVDAVLGLQKQRYPIHFSTSFLSDESLDRFVTSLAIEAGVSVSANGVTS